MLPASQRLNAAELLRHPFFSPGSAKEILLCSPVQTLDSEFEPLNVQTGREHVSPIELHGQNGRQEFILRGKTNDNKSIKLSLRISDFYGKYLMQMKLKLDKLENTF